MPREVRSAALSFKPSRRNCRTASSVGVSVRPISMLAPTSRDISCLMVAMRSGVRMKSLFAMRQKMPFDM